METKKKRISISRVDQYVQDEACFGWELASKDDLRPNHTILLTLQREPKSLDDPKTTKKLEKQFDRLSRRFPTLALIMALVGGGLLAAYFLLKPYLFFYISFLFASLTCFCVSFFSLVIFLILKINRKQIREYLLSEAMMASGVSQEFPTKHNIKEENETTWALSNTING